MANAHLPRTTSCRVYKCTSCKLCVADGVLILRGAAQTLEAQISHQSCVTTTGIQADCGCDRQRWQIPHGTAYPIDRPACSRAPAPPEVHQSACCSWSSVPTARLHLHPLAMLICAQLLASRSVRRSLSFTVAGVSTRWQAPRQCHGRCAIAQPRKRHCGMAADRSRCRPPCSCVAQPTAAGACTCQGSHRVHQGLMIHNTASTSCQ